MTSIAPGCSRWQRAGSDSRLLGTVSRRAVRYLQQRQLSSDARRLFGDPTHPEQITADPLEVLYLDQRHPSAEGYNYFHFRFGTPRYLVALALIDALPSPEGPTLDVGCGAGHLSWALTRRSGSQRVVGVDPSLAQLLTAGQIAPEADFVCADGRSLPFESDRFERVLSSDVLPYVTEKPAAVREMTRVLARSGALVLTALRNARREHVHGGEPLGAQAWLDLARELPHRRILADEAILERYLDRIGPGGLGPEGTETSQTLSVVAARDPISLHEGAWDLWPHARGPLRPHPILEQISAIDGDLVFRRRFPSDTFERDNAAITQYLPQRCTIARSVLGTVVDSDSLDPSTEKLIASVALLGLPEQ